MSLLDGIEHDPGGSRRFRLQPGVRGAADLSECGRYRHLLWRWWDDRGRYVLWIGANPSTAAAEVDDPTIRKEIKFSRRWGYGGMVMANVMDYRATHPEDLLADGVVPRSADNLGTIVRAASLADLIVAAWGALPRPLRRYSDDARADLAGRQLHCLGTTADGSPRHPLYRPDDSRLVGWPR